MSAPAGSINDADTIVLDVIVADEGVAAEEGWRRAEGCVGGKKSALTGEILRAVFMDDWRVESIG